MIYLVWSHDDLCFYLEIIRHRRVYDDQNLYNKTGVVEGKNQKIEYSNIHDDVIKWKHFPRYRPFVKAIHRSPLDSPHKASDA